MSPRPLLVATDIDGTLLDSADRVPEGHRRAFERVVTAGSTLCLATGRPPRWIPEILDMLGQRPFAVCANGAIVMDTATGQILRAQLLAPDVLRELDHLVKDALPGVGLAAERLGVDAVDDEFVASPDYRHAWIQPESVRVGHDDVISRPALKLLARVPGMTSSEMAERVGPRVAHLAAVTYSTENGLIEFAQPGVSKARSLAFLAEKIGVLPSRGAGTATAWTASVHGAPGERGTGERGTGTNATPARVPRTVAFGDMPNDVEMLRWADHGVAMGNAHERALAAADEVTASSDEAGIAPVLERWFPPHPPQK